MRREQGFSTMMALGLAALVGLMAVAWSAMREQQMKTVKFAERKAFSANLARQITDLFQDPALCSCQLNAPGIVFDATRTDGSQSIELAQMRTACGSRADPGAAGNGRAWCDDG